MRYDSVVAVLWVVSIVDEGGGGGRNNGGS